MEKLILLTSKYLFTYPSSLEDFLSFIKYNSKNLSITPFTQCNNISQSDIIAKLNELIDLVVHHNKWEILYYIVSLIRSACQDERIDLTSLLEKIMKEKKQKIFKIEKIPKIKRFSIALSITKNEKFKKKARSSQYRGVSKTGVKWQVNLMFRKKLYYCGSYFDELEAAKTYDMYAVKYYGKMAKTNFKYSNTEIEEMMQKFENN